MTINEKVKNEIYNLLGYQKIQNPTDERYLFIGDEERVRLQKLEECRVWYLGSSDELDNFYLAREAGENAKEPIYNRNKKRYFWSLSEQECDIKKIHTGIPKAAINTLVNCIQDFDITCEACQDKIDAIVENNNLAVLFNQKARPLTFAEGDGAFKVCFDKRLSKTPIIQYYEAKDVDFAVKGGLIVGIIYKDYYKYQNKNYVLIEIRTMKDNNAFIKFELYKIEKSEEIIPVELNAIPELADLPKEGYIIEGLGEILGVQNKYFNDPLDDVRGLSILAGKIDIADDMDMLASIESMTEQNSGPVEYYPSDMLKRDKNGKPQLPKVFGRRFVKKPGVPGPDGQGDNKIDTSAPQLNFEQYHNALTAKTNLFLSGWLSPASFTCDLANKDNAEAQREREKVTIMTRNNVIAMEEKIIKKLMKICLMIQEYLDTGIITVQDYDISVKYSEFASPTFETKAQTLYPMYTAGAISEEMYVDKLYGDSLSETEKLREINSLKQKSQESNFMNSMEGSLEDDGSTNMGQSGETTEESPQFEG